MKNFKNSKLGKYFLYMLLCVCSFAFWTLLGMFIIGDVNVLTWSEPARFIIVLLTLATTAIYVATNEIVTAK